MNLHRCHRLLQERARLERQQARDALVLFTVLGLYLALVAWIALECWP